MLRKILIAAPDSVIFALVNDFHKWNSWSPWANLDPAMKESHEGPQLKTVAEAANSH